MHFYQTIQLRHLQDQELMIPRNFVERYWKDVSNPISLRLPNDSMCKMFWVQFGDDIWLQDWKKLAWSLRCGDLLVFQYKGGSDFHVIIFDDSKLEIDYSSMICNSEEEAKDNDDDDDDDDGYVEITNEGDNTAATTQVTNPAKQANGNRGGSSKKAKKCLKTVDANKRSCTDSHPNENPNFTLKLSRSYVEGDQLRIPHWFSEEYKNELLQGNATIRSAGDEKTWNMALHFNERNRHFTMGAGWKSFSQERNLQVGDDCKFEMTQREPLSFTMTIVPATKEPLAEQFQENQRVKEKSKTSPVEDMRYVGNYGEGISRSCPKTHDSESPNLHNKFNVFVTTLDKLVIPSEFLKRHNISNGNTVVLKVGEGTWFVEVSYNQHLDYGWFAKGWPEFVTECKVKIGDTCLFEIIDVQNHVFKVSIILDV
ncbi:B3 domain-containing transcription factor VRN1 [Trifolium repens]|nr:B3 domain-containing transcription factor VRN1 [Trifolium repens]